MDGYTFVISLLLIAVLVLVLWRFGPRLRSFTLKLLGLELRAELDPVPVRHGRELVEDSPPAAAATTGSATISISGRAEATAGALPVSVSAQSTPPLISDKDYFEDKRRAQLEIALNDAARWGWAVARMGTFKEFPHPVIEWDDKGDPVITHGDTNPKRFANIERLAGELVMRGEGTMSVGIPLQPSVVMKGEGTLSVGEPPKLSGDAPDQESDIADAVQ